MMEEDISAKGSKETVAEIDTAAAESPEENEKAVASRRASSDPDAIREKGEGGSEEVGDGGVPDDEDPNAKYVTNLRPNDVLLGRGTGPNNNAGNVVFRTVVEKLKQPYLSTPSRIKKRHLVRKAVETVKGKNGRFLSRLKKSEIKRLGLLHPENPVLGRMATSLSLSSKKSANTSNKGLRKVGPVYEVVDDEVAMEKTKQALRYICYKKDNPRRKRPKEGGAGDDGDGHGDGDDSSADGADDRSGGGESVIAGDGNDSSDGDDATEATSKGVGKEAGNKVGSATTKSPQKKRRRTLSSSAKQKQKDDEEKIESSRSPAAATIKSPQLPPSSQVLPGQLADISQRLQHQQEETLMARAQNVHHSLLSSYLAQPPTLYASSLQPTNAASAADQLLREHLLASAAAASSAVYDPHRLAAAAGGTASAAAAARIFAMQQYQPTAAVDLSSLLNRPADPFVAAALQQEQYFAAATARQRAEELAFSGSAAAAAASSLYHSSPPGPGAASLAALPNPLELPGQSLPSSSSQRRTSDESDEASRMDVMFRRRQR